MLVIKNLYKNFPILGGLFNRTINNVHAVNDVSLEINKGETLGLVGESGCGKSTLGKMIVRLIEPTSGKINFQGEDILQYGIRDHRLKKIRKKIQIIFQDPYASLNPRMNVRTILSEPIKVHKLATSSKDLESQLFKLLDYVQLPKDSLTKYAHEFSGGQRQRIAIARALSIKPEFIVCDEPVSALDVSIQAQVVNLLMDLQKELNLTYLFVSHDLKVIEYISSRIAVMYLGKIVEIASVKELYTNPKHPYTWALFSAIPIPNKKKNYDEPILEGELPSPINLPTGCFFAPRCKEAKEICFKSYPAERDVTSTHKVSCHRDLTRQ